MRQGAPAGGPTAVLRRRAVRQGRRGEGRVRGRARREGQEEGRGRGRGRGRERRRRVWRGYVGGSKGASMGGGSGWGWWRVRTWRRCAASPHVTCTHRRDKVVHPSGPPSMFESLIQARGQTEQIEGRFRILRVVRQGVVVSPSRLAGEGRRGVEAAKPHSHRSPHKNITQMYIYIVAPRRLYPTTISARKGSQVHCGRRARCT